MKEHADLKNKYKDYIKSKPNVVGIGVGKRQIDEKMTDEKAVVVLVSRKVPEVSLRKEELIPRQLEGKTVDVVEVGEIHFLEEKKIKEGKDDTEKVQGKKDWSRKGEGSASRIPGKIIRKNTCFLSGEKAESREVDSLKTRTEKHRPAPGGISIGHYLVTAGTLGTAVHDKAAAGNGGLLALSNNHVLANSTTGNDGRAARGDKILQPGAHDGGKNPDDTWGRLERFVPLAKDIRSCAVAVMSEEIINRILSFSGTCYRVRFNKNKERENLVDAAVAKPIMDSDLSTTILGLGRATGIADTRIGEEVAFSGRTSGVRKGIVLTRDVHITVSMGDGRSVVFTDQLVTSALALPGDSGSLLLNNENDAVGLVFAGSDTVSVCNRMENVAALLQIEI